MMTAEGLWDSLLEKGFTRAVGSQRDPGVGSGFGILWLKRSMLVGPVVWGQSDDPNLPVREKCEESREWNPKRGR